MSLNQAEYHQIRLTPDEIDVVVKFFQTHHLIHEIAREEGIQLV